MRLWTIHPRYLDARGLVGLWREGLLAKKVLAGGTQGYRHHPQLERFRGHPNPAAAIDRYLWWVYREAQSRGYAFDRTRVSSAGRPRRLTETRGQIEHEWRHLLAKLRSRSPVLHRKLLKLSRPEPHPFFRIVPGEVRSWERMPARGRPRI